MGVKVLIVDDSTLVRKNIKRLLGVLKDLQIYESSDYKSAIDQIETILPDILLLDLRLPDASGYTILKYLSNKKNKPLVIVLTNNSDEESKRKCFKEGCDYFFDKSKEHRAAIMIVKDFSEKLKADGGSDD